MNAVPDSLIVAVDGGGSNCRACVFDPAGTPLGTARGGSANITTDFDKARETIRATITLAYADAGLDPGRMGKDFGYLGLAGANIGNNAATLEQNLTFARTRVSSDREIAVAGALGDGNGTVAQVGTGSFFSAQQNGRLRHIGGWGFQLSDDCSGATLGRQILRATIAAYDGLAASSGLTNKILGSFDGKPEKLVAFAQTATPGEYAKYAKGVVVAKQGGDVVAGEILTSATARMVEILDIIGARSIGPICLLGGLGPTYQGMLPDAYRALCRDPLGSPLDGAFMLAKRVFAGGRA